MQSYVAMLFYFFIKSKQYSFNNREKECKIIHKWCEWKSESEILFYFPQKNSLGILWVKMKILNPESRDISQKLSIYFSFFEW